MKKIGFDNEKYIELQSGNIRDRIAMFGGKLYLEINPLCAEAMVEMLQAKRFKAIEIMCDFYGKSRFILATI